MVRVRILAGDLNSVPSTRVRLLTTACDASPGRDTSAHVLRLLHLHAIENKLSLPTDQLIYQSLSCTSRGCQIDNFSTSLKDWL